MGKSANIGSQSAAKLKDRRKKAPSPEALAKGILKGDKTALARGLTLIESTKPTHISKANLILEKCLEKATDSIRIGITGVPGVGKSTFIEVFGSTLTNLGKKVAVLAVDPTSTLSKGSILGDKTRMQELVRDPGAFIRPSPSGESLGGVARKTRESIILCEAAGYDCILIETVGVGQSETAVHGMVDFFLLLKLAGAGDELQGIKRGIMEMADAIVINKADGDNQKKARQARNEFERALHLFPPKANGWTPKVLTCSALERTGIKEVWEMIEAYVLTAKKDSSFYQNRKKQNKQWLYQTLDNRLSSHFYENARIKKMLKSLLVQVEENKISPFRAAEELLEQFGKELK